MKTDRRKRILAASLILSLGLFALALSQPASAELYKKGSSGPTVEEIQTRLKNWGYYSGEVDGVYGGQTEKAVRYFQRKNGLGVDGQVGDETLAALGMQNWGGSSSSSGSGGSSLGEGDMYLLARLISAEARGEPYEGQVAVGAVVLNRLEHPSFPNSISAVIYQKDAFTCLYDGQWDEPIAESAYRAAQDAVNGWDPSYGALYYFNPVTATSEWIWSRPLIVTIGRHRFCA